MIELTNNTIDRIIVLYASDKKNKVYKKCLEDETEKIIDDLSKKLDDGTIMMLVKNLEMFPEENDMREFGVSEKVILKVLNSKKIIERVYKNRFCKQV